MAAATDRMHNQAMKRALDRGQATDVSGCERTVHGDYILPSVREGQDYCDAQREEWIWSVARLTKPLPSVMADNSRRTLDIGTLIASTTTRYYPSSDCFECVWLR